MKTYTLLYYATENANEFEIFDADDYLSFTCQAEDQAHAFEQLFNAEPTTIVSQLLEIDGVADGD